MEMPYSEARLHQVEELFNGCVSRFRVLPVQYNLRERGKKRPEILASWHDDSDDEDYDPEEDRSPKKHKSPMSRSGGAISRGVRKARNLAFFSQANRANGSENSFDLETCHSEPELEPDVWDQRWAVDTSISPNSRYQMRPRAQPQPESPNKAKTDIRVATRSLVPASAFSSTPQNDNDPVRGCQACGEIKQICSLASDPDLYAYPCIECEEDGFDCVVIPKPKWKRSCEKCRSNRGEPCSYRFVDYDHELPCHSCLDHGYPCVAGPARHVPIARMPEDADETCAGHLTTHVTNRSDDDEPMQGAALDNTEPSELSEPSPIQSITLSDTGNGNNDTVNAYGDEDMQEAPVQEGSAAPITDGHDQAEQHSVSFGQVCRIQTEFAHPLHFGDHRDVPQEGPTCHWCHNFAYGIVGLGVRNPDVINFGTKMVEMSYGHTGEEKEETRMCLQCVLNRIQIIQCTHGSVDRLRAADAEREASEGIAEWENFIRARDAILNPETIASGPAFSTNREWCALCRSLAAWTCKTPQSSSICDPAINCENITYGCGLHLCQPCCELVKFFNGDLNAVHDHYVHEGGEGMQLRADSQFILSGSSRNILHKLMLVE
ncbi:hypothetical protein N7508_001056 [Penicillium antarcticum]|uniref:uncharacterized protein n=1 Tax=Penicillium antarcticum TaxID=416450 RepID=UPI00239CD894|nr:uncharacterized protein N7508_001056 [Penicillium antarcticum]KAJ5316548.1 hypothetical protein N7508_001056 [Penicillium antarcticum]